MCKLIMIDDDQVQHLIMQKMFDHCHLFQGATHSLNGRVTIEFLQINQANSDPGSLPGFST